MTKDYYKILKVNVNANETEIKKSYRQLQMKHHPDREGTTENNDICSEINNAYEILSDPKKRSHYDMMRNMQNNPFMSMCGLGGQGLGASMSGIGVVPGMRNMNMNGSENMQDLFTNIFAEALSSELEDLMNQSSNSNGPKIHVFGGNSQGFMNSINKKGINNQINPEPIEKTVNITLEQAYTGCNIPITIERIVILNRERKKENETIYVNIEKGVDNDEIINIDEKGHNINNVKGIVKLFVKIKNNTSLERDGLNLIYNKTLTFKESLCGFSFDIDYIDGRTLKLNSNGGNIVYNGYKKVIPNLGIERKENIGNLIIKFMVSYPDKLTEEQIEKLKEIL